MIRQKLPLLYIIFLVALVIFIGCNKVAEKLKKENTFNPESFRAEIEAKNTALCRAMVTNDSLAMFDFYSEDARIMAPGEQIISGKISIKEMIANQIKSGGIKEMSLLTSNLTGSENALIEEGTYAIGDGNGKTINKGKYVTAWKKENNEWKCYIDIWNSNMPPQVMKK